MPTTVERLLTHLGIAPGRPVDQAALQDAADSANDLVAQLRTDLPPLVDEDGNPVDPASVVWPPRADEAATLQAARLYGRRGSVQGVAAFADAGVSLLARMDPDVRVLLELGEYQKSSFA
jgi:hypothetical protein